MVVYYIPPKKPVDPEGLDEVTYTIAKIFEIIFCLLFILLILIGIFQML